MMRPPKNKGRTVPILLLIYEVFTKALSEINLPEDLIRNPEPLQLFKTHVYEKTPDKEHQSPENDKLAFSPAKKRARKLQWKTNF